MIYRCILPEWARVEYPQRKRVLEGEFSLEEVQKYNSEFYNIYYLPNYPSTYDSNKTVDGTNIDVFDYVFVDMDLKDGTYASKEDFIKTLKAKMPECSYIVDSGNGIHAYWKINDLDVMSYLRLQRRLIKYLDTDDSLATVYQLMRYPTTFNTKVKGQLKPCDILEYTEKSYTCEEISLIVPPIMVEDEIYCQEHYNRTYNLSLPTNISDDIPLKFYELMTQNTEVKSLWVDYQGDRSKADFRLGHIMHAHGFSKSEATSVLLNTSKALTRGAHHQLSYACGIVDKIWAFELKPSGLTLSKSVKDILQRAGDQIKGTRFPCWSYLDNTKHGLRLGQVIGLVAGSGVGKTTLALNMFEGFVKNNPDCEHFFVPLEQPANEIADRWRALCGNDTSLHEKVHIISNYDDSDNFRHLSLSEIKDYIIKFQKEMGKKVGCVVIDHIGALKKVSKNGEQQGLMDICHEMKAFAVQTNTLLVMQSQAPRAKAGIGDIELDKDAAYGTVYFESYCDYLITLWQPLKRCYSDADCPTGVAFKFCKIRHKHRHVDKIQEDVPYRLVFDTKSERLRELTQKEEQAFDFYNIKATNKRKEDKRTDLVTYTTINVDNGKSKNNTNLT